MNYTFFLSVGGIFSQMEHILGHKFSLKGFDKINIIESIFSNQNEMKLEINNHRKIHKVVEIN